MNTKNNEMRAADVSPLVVTDTKTQGLKSRGDEPWVTMADVCEHFRMSRTTVWRMVGEGMPVHRLGHRVRFLVSEVHAWLAKSERKRFAENGRAASLEEARRRIVMIPILEGMEIVMAQSATRPCTL
jgi:excisionase family DNA binding protein